MNDIEPQDGDQAPSDQELRSLGLEPVKSWVRKAPTGKSARNRRHREKALANGQRQLCSMVPEEGRPLVRDLCRQLCDGEISSDDLKTAVRSLQTGSDRSTVAAHSDCSAPLSTRFIRLIRITRPTFVSLGVLAAFVLGLALGLLS